MKPLTDKGNIVYNKGKPVKCECGQVIAYMRDGKLMLYCKHCKQQIPFKIIIEPEP